MLYRCLFSLIFSLPLLADAAESPRALPRQALFVSYGTYGSTEHRTILETLRANDYALTVLSPNYPDFAPPVTPAASDFLSALSNFAEKSEYRGLQTLLVFMDLHGELQTKGERTHSVRFGEEHFSLDRIQPVLRKLSDRGVKVGIVSFACNAGDTVRLADQAPNVCVLTSSDERTPAIPWVMNVFARSFAEGGSLTEIFRRTRIGHYFPTLLRISTPIGQQIARETLPLRDFFQSSPESALPWFQQIDFSPSELSLVEQGMRDLQNVSSPLGIDVNLVRSGRLIQAERLYFDRRYSELTAEHSESEPSAVDVCDAMTILRR